MDLLNYRAKAPFAQKHLLTLNDWTGDEILQTLSLALKVKKDLANNIRPKYCDGKALGMIFTKSSTRTRVSFETGIYQLGGYGMFLSGNDIQLGRGEPIADTAKVLSGMIDGIMIRTFAQSDVEALAQHGSIPVINGLTDDCHPCQILADLLTYYEHRGTLEGKLTFIGDGNNVANSLLVGCAKVGMDVSIGCPDGYTPDPKFVRWAMEAAEQTGAKVEVTPDYEKAVNGADCIYTDVFTSMGQEAESAKRLADFAGCQVNEALAKRAKSDYIFLHCLPAHRGEEVTAEVIDGPHSVVFDEAHNRLHAQKAVMIQLMGKSSCHIL